MSELTRAQRKAEEVLLLKTSVVTISPRQEAAAAVAAASMAAASVTAAVEVKDDHSQRLAQKEQAVAELERKLEQKIIDLEGAKTKIAAGHEEQMKEKDATIEKLQAQILELQNKDSEAVIKEHETRIATLEKVQEENKQLQLDRDHLRKTAEYEQKMMQEALNAAEAKLSATVEENSRLHTKLVDLLSKLQLRSKMTKALSELDDDIADLSDHGGILVVPDSSKTYQTCHAIDVDKIEESLNHLHTEQRDDFSVQEAEVEVDTTMNKLANVMACGTACGAPTAE